MNSYAERLRHAMKIRNVKQKELAEAIGVKQQSIGYLCKLDGKEKKSAYTSQIAKYLKVNPEWLATGAGAVLIKSAGEPGAAENAEEYVSGADPGKITFQTFPATITHGVEDSAKILGGIEEWDSDTPLSDDEVALKFLKSVEASAGIGSQVKEIDNGYKLRFSKVTLQRRNISPDQAVCILVTGNSMEPQLPDGSTVGVNTADTKIVDGKIYAIKHGDMIRIKVLYTLPNGGLRLKSFNHNEHPDEIYTFAQRNEQQIDVIGRVFWSSVLY